MSTPTSSPIHRLSDRSSRISTIPMSDRTPIRIRGKKRAHPQSEPPKTASVETPPSKTPRPTSKKLKKHFVINRHAPRPINPRITSLHRPISPLEALPAELLQQIFLSTCNPALPRSSPLLAAKLSVPHIYKEVLSRLFGQVKCASNDVWRLNSALDENDEYLSRARGEALKCRWMTWALFGAHRDRVVEQERRRLAMAFSPGSSRYSREFHGDGLDLWLGSQCYIPSKLLRWPCGGADFEFLRTLARMGSKIDSVNSFDPERIVDMFRGAVEDRDYRLMHLLMLPGLMGAPREQHVNMALDVGGHDVAIVLLLARRLMAGKNLNFREVPDEDGIASDDLFGLMDKLIDYQTSHSEFGDDGSFLYDMPLKFLDEFASRHSDDKEWASIVRGMGHLVNDYDSE